MGGRTSVRAPQDQVHSLFGSAGGAHDEALVALQNRQPVLDIGCVVAEAPLVLQPHMADQRGRADLRDQLFLAVILCAEEGRTRQAVQTGGVACAVHQLMEGCAVVFRRAHELLADREDDLVG